MSDGKKESSAKSTGSQSNVPGSVPPRQDEDALPSAPPAVDTRTGSRLSIENPLYEGAVPAATNPESQSNAPGSVPPRQDDDAPRESTPSALDTQGRVSGLSIENPLYEGAQPTTTHPAGDVSSVPAAPAVPDNPEKTESQSNAPGSQSNAPGSVSPRQLDDALQAATSVLGTRPDSGLSIVNPLYDGAKPTATNPAGDASSDPAVPAVPDPGLSLAEALAQLNKPEKTESQSNAPGPVSPRQLDDALQAATSELGTRPNSGLSIVNPLYEGAQPETTNPAGDASTDPAAPAAPKPDLTIDESLAQFGLGLPDQTEKSKSPGSLKSRISDFGNKVLKPFGKKEKSPSGAKGEQKEDQAQLATINPAGGDVASSSNPAGLAISGPGEAGPEVAETSTQSTAGKQGKSPGSLGSRITDAARKGIKKVRSFSKDDKTKKLGETTKVQDDENKELQNEATEEQDDDNNKGQDDETEKPKTD